MEITTEDLIGCTIIDALDGCWLEVRLPDGTVAEVSTRQGNLSSELTVRQIGTGEAVDLTV